MGVALLLAGIAALNRVRMEIPLEKENQVKLVKFMIRIAIFSVLYLVPLLAVLGCYLYENSYRPDWETSWVQEKCREYHIPCPSKVEHPPLRACVCRAVSGLHTHTHRVVSGGGLQLMPDGDVGGR